MDAEEQFLIIVKETVAALVRKGKGTKEWKSDDGHIIRGWSVKRWDRAMETEGNPARGWWRETWGNGCTILTKECEFWEYSFDGTDEKDKGSIISQSLRKTPGPYLVGTKGKPFSEITGILERMPYL
jgi:hypothetical protein